MTVVMGAGELVATAVLTHITISGSRTGFFPSNMQQSRLLLCCCVVCVCVKSPPGPVRPRRAPVRPRPHHCAAVSLLTSPPPERRWGALLSPEAQQHGIIFFVMCKTVTLSRSKVGLYSSYQLVIVAYLQPTRAGPPSSFPTEVSCAPLNPFKSFIPDAELSS